MLLTPAQKWLLFFSAILGLLAVAAGAFGSHALKSRLAQDQLVIFEVAARYQMYHALAIGLALFAAAVLSSDLATCAGWIFVVGTLIFSGSLYLLVFTGLKTFGAVTPMGGVLLLIGWFCLAISAFTK